MGVNVSSEFWNWLEPRIAIDANGCWVWLGRDRSGRLGTYRRTRVNGKHLPAHRYVYERVIGVIPASLVIDHKCRNTLCVNPDHLEPVTPKENVRRGVGTPASKTHCSKGHPLSGENLATLSRGERVCRICRYRRTAEYRLRVRGNR